MTLCQYDHSLLIAFSYCLNPQADDSDVADLLGFASSPRKQPPAETAAPDTATVPPSGVGGAPLIDDLFSPPTNANWEDPWVHARNGANLNPFDPFGTATQPPEGVIPPSPVPGADFDPFGTSGGGGGGVRQPVFMHTSNSTSNLETGNGSGGSAQNVHSSVSSSNLTRNNNPFEEFDAFFEAAASAAKGGSPAAGPSPAHQHTPTNGE